MQHKTLRAKTTVIDTELGEFTALVSAWGADREKDVIAKTAFDDTIRAWRVSHKKLPLLFEHSTEVVGSIDPETMEPTDDGLVASGHIDREAEHGEQAWRMIKSGVAGFSIGFMSESRKLPDGTRELVEVDLLEVSVTSKPMHPSTRALAWKTAMTDEERYEKEMLRIFQRTREEVDAEVEAKLAATKAAKPREPITVKRFAC